MSLALGQSWAASACAVCDPVMESAGVGFQRQIGRDASGLVVTLLWEADPARFAARYPDSEIIESYGDSQWRDVYCIDYWVYVDAVAAEARIAVEGWSLADQVLPLTGDGRTDGLAIGDVMARILCVPAPS